MELNNAGTDKRLLKEHAYTVLKDAVVMGEFTPGTLLSERRLVSQLGMSKTPIRAALERLEMEGFVSISPQQGILVRELSLQEIADQFEIRAALESHVLARVSARGLTSEQVQRIESNLKAMDGSTKKGEHATIVRLDAEFHLLFCEFLGNMEILKTMLQLREKIHRVVFKVIERASADRSFTSLQEHHLIAEAVIKGEAELAVKRIVEHLEFGKQCLINP